jgi:hypothetical protein
LLLATNVAEKEENNFNIDFTEEHLNTVIEYLKMRKPKFYAEYIADVPFFKPECNV